MAMPVVLSCILELNNLLLAARVETQVLERETPLVMLFPQRMFRSGQDRSSGIERTSEQRGFGPYYEADALSCVSNVNA